MRNPMKTRQLCRCPHRCGMELRGHTRVQTRTGKQAVLIPWQVYPTMQQQPREIRGITCKQAGLHPTDHRIYFICRSGGRSLAAAQAARAAGYKHVYNVKDGFEGPPDARAHRGAIAGWKADGLPWKQG